MRAARVMAAMAAGVILGVACGCDSGGSGGSSSSGTTLVDQTVSIPMAGTHLTGVFAGPGDGVLTGRVKSVGGSTLEAWFIKVSDSSVVGDATGADFNITTGTTTGQTWRVAVFNPSGVSIDTTISVVYAP